MNTRKSWTIVVHNVLQRRWAIFTHGSVHDRVVASGSQPSKTTKTEWEKENECRHIVADFLPPQPTRIQRACVAVVVALVHFTRLFDPAHLYAFQRLRTVST